MDAATNAIILRQPDDAANDYADWLEQLILGRELTPQELEQISVKTAYWWAIAQMQRDLLNRAHSLN